MYKTSRKNYVLKQLKVFFKLTESESNRKETKKTQHACNKSMKKKTKAMQQKKHSKVFLEFCGFLKDKTTC